MKAKANRNFSSKTNRSIRLFCMVLLIVFAFSVSSLATAQAAVWYVKTNGLDSNAGTSWDEAFQTIQKAVDAASNSDEIWVKQGQYVPSATISVNKGVTIYGGFSETVQSPVWADRDWETYETMVDGNNPNGFIRCFHVRSDSSVTIDGFTVTQGYAYGDTLPGNAGGGILNEYSPITVTHCTFSANRARYGSGICNYSDPPLGHYASAVITDCVFTGNTEVPPYGYGGGIHNEQSDNVTISDCSFTGNNVYRGGGISNYSSDCTIRHSKFSSNNIAYSGSCEGGGIWNRSSTPTIEDCSFSNNYQAIFNTHDPPASPVIRRCNFSNNIGSGAAIFNSYYSQSRIIDCRFTGNTAPTGYGGGAIYNGKDAECEITGCTFIGNQVESGIPTYDQGGAIYNNRGTLTITNCIFAGNGNDTMEAGGAIYIINDQGSKIINCTFYGNKIGTNDWMHGGGAIFNGKYSWYKVTITNCVFWGNSGYPKTDIRSVNLDLYYDPGDHRPMYTYIVMQQTGAWEVDLSIDHNLIRQNPLFVNVTGTDPYAWNLHIRPDSPCVDAGNDSAVPSGITTDIDEDGRILDGDNSGIATVDIGADEYIDTDSDGVQDSEEMGPDGDDPSYDGNDDGAADSQQNNVASMHTYNDEDYVTLASDNGALSNVQAIAPPGTPPGGVDFEYGCFDFTVTGVVSGDFTSVKFFGPEGAVFDTYYKYGQTSGNPTPHWYEFLFDVPSQTGAQFDGNEITLHFVDGQRGDDDLSPNGTIVEPGGPAIVLAPECEGNFDGDTDVDGSDLAVFAADFGRTDCGSAPPCEGDFDTDGDVDGSDLAVFAADFGRTDCP